MEEFFIFGGTIFTLLVVACSFGFVNNLIDNRSVEALVSKGTPALEAMCAIRPNKEICIGVMVKKQ